MLLKNLFSDWIFLLFFFFRKGTSNPNTSIVLSNGLKIEGTRVEIKDKRKGLEKLEFNFTKNSEFK